MFTITELQRDALNEMFNIGVGRAASSLSQIVGEPIELTAPELFLLKPDDAANTLLGSESRKFSAVSQTFTGPFVARAMLVFPEINALEIIRLMVGEHLSIEELSEFEQEAMSEVGNIILNASISALSDMFGIDLQGSLPSHQFAEAKKLLNDGHHEDVTVILVIHVDLIISKQHIQGHILFLLSVDSLQNLLQCVDTYLIKHGLI
jgi:chemotaxis protein CheC